VLVERQFGVHYHRDHMGRLMPSLNWSHQKPERRALERDEQAIERGKQKDWPRVKKTLRGWAPTSSSSTHPDSSNVVKTWAPRGQTPVLHHYYRRERISVISGVSVSPQREPLGLY